MDKLKEIIAYILKQYPIKSELSNARVTKLIYLSDWHQAIKHNRQISPIQWYFDNYGPYVPDVQYKVSECPTLFLQQNTVNMFGSPKTVFILQNPAYEPSLGEEEKASINHVIAETSKLNWGDFINLIYSTYPIISSERYSKLDLLEKASEYSLT
jgi:hypothetical protein